jgi:osmotically-inducible protein OsmY
MRMHPRADAGPKVLLALFMLILAVSLFAGCAARGTSESTGEYVDDSAITAKVKTAIFKDPSLKTTEIKVETFKGVVQLSGFVDSQDSVRRAADLAASVPGVVSVKNDLIVK